MVLGYALVIALVIVMAYVAGVYVGFRGCQRMYEEAIAKAQLNHSRTRVSELYPERDNE